MQEISNSIIKTNLRIMGIKEGEEVQAKGIHNIFNKKIEVSLNKYKKIEIDLAFYLITMQ
jgi:hypothetical protein